MSEPTEVQQTVETILSDVLRVPVEELRQQPVLASYQWDSLAMLEALAQLESSLGVSLDLRYYQQARTVEDLLALIAQSRSGAPAGQR
ncbi:MAG TPA: acyl carrier protein [Jatrophihabitans sp.]|nr:acyl carrier protein [Jatrophihabitans sp.]